MQKIQFTKKLKDLWLEDLKSGNFVQMQGVYRYKGGHCCLAVLQESYKRIKPYSGLTGMQILNECKIDFDPLISANDDWIGGEAFVPDYSNVIPLIEKLPTDG